MLQWIVIGVTVFFHSLVAYVVLRNNSQSLTNRLIAYLSLISIIWAIFNHLPYTTDDESLKLLYVRAVMFFTAPLGLIIFLLSLVYPNQKFEFSSTLQKYLVLFSFVATIAIALLSLTNAVFSGLISKADGSFELIPGDGMKVYVSLGVGLLVYGFYIFIKKYRSSSGIIKKQLQLFLFGLLSAFSLMLSTNLFAVVVLRTVALSALGPLFTLIFVYSIAYAIRKHRFLDLSGLVVRSLIFAFITLVAALLYSSSLFGFFYILYRQTIPLQFFFVSIAFAVILAFSFPYIKRILEKITQKYLFVYSYDSTKLLYEIAVHLGSTIQLENLSRNFLTLLMKRMRLSHAALFLVEKNGIYQIVTVGVAKHWEIDEKKLADFNAISDAQFFEEITDGSMKRLMRRYDARVVAPLRSKGQLTGILFLGNKLSGEPYGETDANVISIISPQVALSIENAKAYEEIRRFNITLREEVERATNRLLTANQKLKQLDKLKDEFVSIASHELRTPMVSIKNYLWMALAGKGGKLTEKQEFYLQRAHDSANRMTKLINDMLNISRIESGRILLHVAKVDIADLIDRMIDENKARAKQLKVHLERRTEIFRRDSRTNIEVPFVLADQDKVAEVIVNLISNALKFTPEDGSVTLTIDADDEYAYISVIDTGVGLDKDQIPKLFKKFGMIKDSYRSYSEAAQGTGLGLYVSKSIIELHEGDIWVTSKGKDTGSVFTFTLRLYDEKDEARINKKFDHGKDAGIITTTLSDSE